MSTKNWELESGFIQYDDKSIPSDAVHLFAENKPVNDHNEKY